MMPMEKKMKRDWSKLDDDLLRDIADRVADDAVEDYIRFRAVCTSWRSATVDIRHHRKIPPQLPWLMLTFDEEASSVDQTRSFYRHSDGKTITLNLPEVLNYRIIGSSEGWLVLVHESGAFRLFNPLTGAQISLPALTTLPFVSYCPENVDAKFMIEHGFPCSGNDMRDLLVNKVITITQEEDHGGSGGPVMLVAMLAFSKLAFARVGDDRWTVVDEYNDYGDILFYRGKLYAVNAVRLIIAVDISSGPSNISFTTLASATYKRRGVLWYLTPTEDDQGLLLVGRCYGNWRGSALMATKSFEVFRADNLDGDMMKVTRVKSLGDSALFLGTNSAMSFNVKGVNRRGGWKKDCIYFTQSVSDYKPVTTPCQGDKLCEHAGDDLGVFSLKDASIEPLPRCPDGSFVVWPQPIWFCPNLRHQTSSSSI